MIYILNRDILIYSTLGDENAIIDTITCNATRSNLYDIPIIIEDTPSEPIKSYVNKMQNLSDKTFVERATNFTEQETKVSR